MCLKLGYLLDMKLSRPLAAFVEITQAPKIETPCYVYSESVLREIKKTFDAALANHKFPLPLRWHYAMKANALPQLLRFFKDEGAGIDLVSGGELKEALACGFKGEDLVFSGIGKKDNEIREALRQGVMMLNVESESELNRIERISKEMGIAAKFSLRVNPDVDAKTHPYISTGMWEHKFGLPFDQAFELYKRTLNSKDLVPVGISLHIGSQIFDVAVLEEAVQKISTGEIAVGFHAAVLLLFDKMRKEGKL